ncbi:MAG: hypothetical protein C5B44_00625 [Acidobacteria bacterium]|nr:MAG: hypothetical protein C5B44_00625 [Acidobacteriota bacterium]
MRREGGPMVNERMKVLIAYDGSVYADAALDDLRRAGLPQDTEALIVSVSDSVFHPSSSIAEITGKAVTSRRLTSTVALLLQESERALDEAKEFAASAGWRLRSYFPDWEVRTEVIVGTPSQELVRRADEWKPDLVVVGSRGRSALGRFFLGSVSKTLAEESQSSVRVARRTVRKNQDPPLRIMVGVDGTIGAEDAIRAVGVRVWSEGTEVRLVAVDDGSLPRRIADIDLVHAKSITIDNEGKAVNARVMLDSAAVELGAIGLKVSVEIKEGEPLRTLIEEANRWEADSIFVGARGFDDFSSMSGLGIVSTGLVANAPCTVEIVR